MHVALISVTFSAMWRGNFACSMIYKPYKLYRVPYAGVQAHTAEAGMVFGPGDQCHPPGTCPGVGERLEGLQVLAMEALADNRIGDR